MKKRDFCFSFVIVCKLNAVCCRIFHMLTKKPFPLIFFSVCFFSCTNQNESARLEQGSIVIALQPFEGIDDALVNFVYSELSKIYPKVIVNTPIKLPETAYYRPRNRYRADSLIEILHNLTPKGQVTVGLTNKDISTTKGKIKDYGIMGLGYQPGRSCVVSTFRLAKNNLLMQYFKVSVHALGHTQGLPHCIVKTCFMRDAEGKNHLDEETGFCPDCMSHLIKRGWTLKS